MNLATVTAATDEGLVVERAGQRIEFPAAYLADGHLDHGYALTVHKALGATYDVALLYGDERLCAEAGYTALTRGRDRTSCTSSPTSTPHRLACSGLDWHGLPPSRLRATWVC